MSSQPLLDLCFSGTPAPTGTALTGSELRDSGIESVLNNTPEAYKEKLIEAIKSFGKGELITAEDVRARAGNPPDGVHFNVFGGLMRRAASKGLIKWTPETETAKRPGMHATRLSLWIKL